MRVRTKDSTVQLYSQPWGENCDGSPYLGSNSPRKLWKGKSKVTTDVVTPRFHSRRNAGEIINNSFHTLEKEYDYEVQPFQISKVGPCNIGVKDYYGDYPWGNPVDNFSMGNAYDPAFDAELNSIITTCGTRAMAGVEAATVQGFVELAELSKTVKLIVNPLSGIRKLISDLRRSKRYKTWIRKNPGRSLIEFISDEWLRYRYGWLPLILTCQDVVDALPMGKPYPRRSTSRSSLSTNGEYKTVSTSTPSISPITYNKIVTTSIEGHVRAGVLYEHSLTLSERWGTSITNIPETVWEIVPFSFVVDWFANVGDYLRAVTPKVGVNVLATWTKVTRVTLHECNCYTTSVSSPWSAPIPPSVYATRRETEVSREPGVDVDLVSKVPQINFEVPIDFIHAADAVALLLSSLRHR